MESAFRVCGHALHITTHLVPGDILSDFPIPASHFSMLLAQSLAATNTEQETVLQDRYKENFN